MKKYAYQIAELNQLKNKISEKKNYLNNRLQDINSVSSKLGWIPGVAGKLDRAVNGLEYTYMQGAVKLAVSILNTIEEED